MVGTQPKIDRKVAAYRKKNSPNAAEDLFSSITNDDLDELLTELDVGYENRLRAFRLLQ